MLMGECLDAGDQAFAIPPIGLRRQAHLRVIARRMGHFAFKALGDSKVLVSTWLGLIWA
jgi:hypothetical protein